MDIVGGLFQVAQVMLEQVMRLRGYDEATDGTAHWRELRD